MKKYISIDIGGTAIKYGIVSEDAEVLLKKEMKTEGLLQVCKGQLLVFLKDFKQNSDTI